MGARRSGRKRFIHPLLVFGLGMTLGAGLATGYLLARYDHAVRTPRVPSATRPAVSRPSPPPAVPRQERPQPPSPQPPRQNPEVSRAPAVVPGPAVGRTGRPRVAVIFDDAGYGLKAAREIEAIGRPVTISVLPHLPYSNLIAEEAPGRGVQVILHLPMEPDNDTIKLGEGGIKIAMSDEEIRQTVVADLASVPGAVGANNHMGSLGTADTRVMRAVLEEMRSRRLFFVDSVTSPRSVAAQVAREMGVPTTARAVFLDNQDDEEYVRGQFRALIAVALARGQAVAIGHVGKVTARVLVSLLPEFDEAGIQLVRISDLVR
jgi:polysaccharide deacetylase 2 family uncharacterized protein YibQ